MEKNKTPQEVDKERKIGKYKVLEYYRTNNEMENRILRTFYDAIEENIEDGDIQRIGLVAANITNVIVKNELLGDKNLLRSKVLNLKDKKNKDLCRKVYELRISAERFIYMTLEEMKSEDLKKLESNMQKNILLEMQVPQVQAETNIFKCSKCGKRECSYRQLQTRSADEPMTTFVSCVCGHKWKF